MNIKKILFVIGLMSNFACLQAQPFSASREEEIKNFVDFFAQRNPSWTKEAFYKRVEETFFSSLHPQVIPVSQLIPKLRHDSLLAILLPDMLNTFNILKLKMNIPDDVELYYIVGDAKIPGTDVSENILYDAHERRVYMSGKFIGRTPSTKLYSLIHELTHVQQHQRLGLVGFVNASSFEKEHKADTHGINAICCVICAQMIEDEWPNDNNDNGEDRTSLGYLSHADIKKYREQKKSGDLCKAHSLDSIANKKIRDLMPAAQANKETWINWFFNEESGKELERLNLDWKASKLLQDRLSSVKFKE